MMGARVTPIIKCKVHSELLNILFKQTNHMLWAEAFAASLILFVLWWPNSGDRTLLVGWYGFMVAASGLPRYMLVKAYLSSHPTDEQSYRWEKAVMAMLFISASGWSFAGTVLLPQNNGLNQALVLFLLVGVAATANPFYSPIKKVYATFLIPTLVFTAIGLILRGSNFEIFAGISILTFGVLMLITAVVSSNLIATALTYRYENMALADDLLIANKTLENLATHDTLTKLPNRQLFNKLLSDAILHARKSDTLFAVMFLDIDKFKMINDTLGHDTGDELLVTVAERLKKTFQSNGHVCRLGGDEFIALLDNIHDKNAVTDIAERCCQTLAERMKIKNNIITVTTSIGISIFPLDGVDEETLIKRADTAMYYSKKIGGNSYTFYNDKMDFVRVTVTP